MIVQPNFIDHWKTFEREVLALSQDVRFSKRENLVELLHMHIQTMRSYRRKKTGLYLNYWDTKKMRSLRRRFRETISKLRGDHTPEQWAAMQIVCGSKCVSCGWESEFLTRDHIIPITRKGSNHISNIQPLCRECNSTDKFNHKDLRPEWVRRIFL